MDIANACRRGLGGFAMAVLASLATAHADPVSVRQGQAVLPASGLVIDLPASTAGDYHVSASWSVTEAGIFDARDVVDEMDAASKTVIAGNWVLIGYFDAGGCDEVLASEKLDSSWTTEETLWGTRWKIRAGVYTFANSLGRRPTAILCSQDPVSTRSFLLYRFLTAQPETLGRDAIMADVRSAKVLQAANTAYRIEKYQDIKPLKRPEVTNRGTVSAQRTVKLPVTGLEIDLPDDGYIWLANGGDDSDTLDRMAPFIPELSVEVALIDDATCAEVIEYMIPAEKRLGISATDAPAGWTVAPGIKLDANNELILCRARGDSALLAGVIQSSTRTDVTPIWPILAALAAARDIP